jgi:hypothetical protein
MTKNIIGLRVGSLIVIASGIKKLRKEGLGYRYFVKCKCDCGTEKTISRDSLFQKHPVDSCGCQTANKIRISNADMYTKKRLYKGEAAYRHLLKTYKNRARKLGLDFTLTDDEFRFFTSQNCFYCGVEPKQREKIRGGFGEYIYNGLDRVDNIQGYTLDNIVPCCGVCNRMKYTMSFEEFISVVKTIYKQFELKGTIR